MPLASLNDINTHLPTDKLEMRDSEDDLFQVDAQRIIRGYLSGVFSPETLAAWSDPDIDDPTQAGYIPQTIRAIAGRFIAAAFYVKRYAEDLPDVPEYAQTKYNEAIAMLRQVANGELILTDVSEVVTTGGSLSSDDFYPNDSAPPPLFSITQEFG